MIRRNYISADDVPDDATEDQIALAEELIDAYVGPQQKSIPREVVGKVSSAVGNKIYDTNGGSALGVSEGRFVGGIIEIIGGAGIGQHRNITASLGSDHSITFSGSVFNPALDSTSIFKIYQLAKFPRVKDTKPYGSTYYKAIPEAVRAATIAQVKFILEIGDEYFLGDDSDMAGESIGNYSYNRGGNAGPVGVSKLIAPTAKSYLRGIVNRTGRLLAEDPTWL